MAERRFISPILEKIRREEAAEALDLARDIGVSYVKEVDKRRVFPERAAITNLAAFEEPLPDGPAGTATILEQLAVYGNPATVTQSGGRYFGFVCGGILPAALGAKWVASAWDQNAAMYAMSPAVAVLEEVCEKWIVELLGLPAGTAAGLVSGSATATLAGLAAGRNHLLRRLGYDAGRQGLFGAPEIKVIAGSDAHSTVYKALSISGLGSERLVKVPADEQGRIRADALPEMDGRTLLVLQAGNVNSGAFDAFGPICRRAKAAGAWVHIDGAFGLWAAANPRMRALTAGIELADSWSVDAHKTLNAPYDNGIILCRDREALTGAMRMSGAYILNSGERDGMALTLDMSRRARAVELWAALKSLGKAGVADLVEELHRKAVYFAGLLADGGLEVLNDVVYNQVLVCDADDAATEKLLRTVQERGVCWLGGSRWAGRAVMRISVCSYRTTYEDIEISAREILRCRREPGQVSRRR
jgi:glutamate/tyrosine decarboxylase-like PLP-dependent enzyme